MLSTLRMPILYRLIAKETTKKASISLNNLNSEKKTSPAPRGAFRGCALPNDCLCPLRPKLCPPSEDCVPKKLIGSGLPECKSRPETRKIVLLASEFVENQTIFGIKTRIMEIFELKTFFIFLVFTFFV